MNNKINEEWHLYLKKPLFRVLANVERYFENIFLTSTISEDVEDSSSIKNITVWKWVNLSKAHNDGK